MSIFTLVLPKRVAMKIVLLNPNQDATRSLVKTLQDRGVPMLPCTNPKEALQMLELHGESVDILIIHREGLGGLGEPGIDFIRKFKSYPKFSEIPFILTSEKWTESQCAEHQQTPQGANAYLKVPYNEKDFLAIVEAVSGYPLGTKVPPEPEEYTHVTSLTRVESKGPSAPPPPPEFTTPSGMEDIVLSSAPDEPAGAFGANSNYEALSMSFDTHVHTPFEPAPQPNLKPTPLPPIPGGIPTRPVTDEALGLFDSKSGTGPRYVFSPVEDAIIPGGATQTPDVETLKRYLKLREQDVHMLAQQLKHAQVQIVDLETHLRTEESLRQDLEHEVKRARARLEDFEQIKSVSSEGDSRELVELKFELKTKSDKVRLLEMKVQEASKEVSAIKERVRNDIRKIRTREKELENRIEILKRDSESLLASRENRILELKRKLDLHEFNMDILQEKLKKEQEKNNELDARVERAAKAMRLAGGFLGEDGDSGGPEDAESLQKSGT